MVQFLNNFNKINTEKNSNTIFHQSNRNMFLITVDSSVLIYLLAYICSWLRNYCLYFNIALFFIVFHYTVCALIVGILFLNASVASSGGVLNYLSPLAMKFFQNFVNSPPFAILWRQHQKAHFSYRRHRQGEQH